MLPVTPNTIALKALALFLHGLESLAWRSCKGVSCWRSDGFMPWITFSSIKAVAVPARYITNLASLAAAGIG